jgi:periplasmic copper chaperone A
MVFWMRRRAFAFFLVAALAACERPAPLEIADGWTRDSVGGTDNAAVFMTITSPEADRLVGASTPAAEKTDLMTMESDGGTMAMKYLEAIDIPAGEPVSLDPSGLHVWLADLDAPLKAGDTFPLTLEFETAGKREVTVSVIAPAAAAPMAGMDM